MHDRTAEMVAERREPSGDGGMIRAVACGRHAECAAVFVTCEDRTNDVPFDVGQPGRPDQAKRRPGNSNCERSREQFVNDVAFDVGQPEVTSGIAISEALVVQPQRVQ